MNPPEPKWQARFFTIWTGQTFSLVGSSLVRFAVIWWLTEASGAQLIFHPPCSTSFNPIEPAFVQIKSLARRVRQTHA